jgi:hypothetical protein
VDGDQPVESLAFEHRPATAGQWSGVGAIATFPREFRRRLPIPQAFPVVDVALDVSELE